MLNAILVLSIPFIIILVMVIVAIHRTDTSNIRLGNIKQAVKMGAIGGMVVVILTCIVFLSFIMIPPTPEIEIGLIDKNMAEGVVSSKSRLNCLYSLCYSLLYRVGIYVEHPDKPGALSRAKKYVTKLNWWNGQWNVQGMNIKGSDTVHVFLLRHNAVRNNKYYDSLKKEKGYFMFEDRQIPYGKDKEAEIIDYDAMVWE